MKLPNAITFSQEIEKNVALEESSYIEAVCNYCKATGMDIDAMPKLLTPQLKAKIENEALTLNMFPKRKKRKKLPLK